jgi:hypothetical protein
MATNVEIHVDSAWLRASWWYEPRDFRLNRTTGANTMRFIVMVKASPESEAGAMPTEEELAEMGAFNEQLIKAGVMLDAAGLAASSEGARVRFSGTDRTVIDGPFAETKELVAGYWLWQCRDLAEAIEWVKRCPNPMRSDSEIEIRRIFESEDFGDSPAVARMDELAASNINEH